MEGKFEFGADASGQFFTKGGGVIASFKDGMAISTLTIRGLGYDASLAGQAFNSKKLNKDGKCSKWLNVIIKYMCLLFYYPLIV